MLCLFKIKVRESMEPHILNSKLKYIYILRLKLRSTKTAPSGAGYAAVSCHHTNPAKQQDSSYNILLININPTEMNMPFNMIQLSKNQSLIV